MRTRIKICGVRDIAAARAAAEAGADAVGFVFAEGSPREIEPEEAVEIMFALPPMVSSVGVVRDLDVDEFCEVEQRCPCEMMQLHGDEDDKTVASCGPGVIKAVAFEPATGEAQIRRWFRLREVAAVLIDGPRAGSGEALDWAALAATLEKTGRIKPVILAGGLTAENIGEAIRTIRPYAVDVSSGVESAPGVKDAEKIRAFCRAVAAADAALPAGA